MCMTDAISGWSYQPRLTMNNEGRTAETPAGQHFLCLLLKTPEAPLRARLFSPSVTSSLFKFKTLTSGCFPVHSVQQHLLKQLGLTGLVALVGPRDTQVQIVYFLCQFNPEWVLGQWPSSFNLLCHHSQLLFSNFFIVGLKVIDAICSIWKSIGTNNVKCELCKTTLHTQHIHLWTKNCLLCTDLKPDVYLQHIKRLISFFSHCLNWAGHFFRELFATGLKVISLHTLRLLCLHNLVHAWCLKVLFSSVQMIIRK